MSQILIHYFTGTGNTAHCVRLMTDIIQSHGHKVSVSCVQQYVNPPAGEYDYHIVAFPVLSWTAPVMMKKYIGRMPRGLGIKAAILAVNGATFSNGKLIKGYTGQALEQLEKILIRKNYDIFLTGNASFPDNWTQLTNPCRAEENKIIISLGEKDVKMFTEKFLSNKKELYRCGNFNRIWSLLTAGLFGHLGRRILGKFYVADERCTGCEICARSCPAGTITMHHKMPQWSTTCEDCNRCINICLEQAIQVSVPLLIIQSILNLGLTIGAIWAIIFYLPRLTDLSLLPLISIEIILIVAAPVFLLWITAVPIDALFRLLMRIPVARRFFGISYTQKYRRYTAPGFKPLVGIRSDIRHSA